MTHNEELEILRPQISDTILQWMQSRSESNDPILSANPIFNLTGTPYQSIGEIASMYLSTIKYGNYFLQIGSGSDPLLELNFKTMNLAVNPNTITKKITSAMHDRLWESYGIKAIGMLQTIETNINQHLNFATIIDAPTPKVLLPINIAVFNANINLSKSHFENYPEDADILLMNMANQTTMHTAMPGSLLLDTITLKTIGATFKVPNMGEFSLPK
jgi:hypothetical protein